MANIIEEKATLPAVFLGSSPHIASPVDAQRLMANALISLAPCTIYGVAVFGLHALFTIVVSTGAAIGAEALFRRLTKQDIRIKDLSAALTGLLLALVLPPSTPLWMTALGSVFAIIVAKEFFGGLGANVFNPALAGRAFLIMSFPAAITTWHNPPGRFVVSLPDALSGATPLGAARGLSGAEAIAAVGGGSDYASVMQTLFLGTHGGCIGETSILLILLGAVYLLVTQTIDWRAPAAMLGASALASAALGIDPLFTLMSGGLVFGAVFMATDYVTAPLTAVGKLIFGAGAGLITVLIRKWGAFPEGVSYGLLIMNAVTPFLNHFIQKKYGFVAKAKKVVKP
ncbi:MAG: RnfABCDGE type electron transport complex subunit D [Treponema sp.]|jgi:electron transport complex protein RnfD|nr:RnfABCDGE type electron transport complex subunit D [Treponema sp.]